MRRYAQFIQAGAEQTIFSGAGGRVIVLDPSATVNVYIRDKNTNQEYRLVPGAVVKFEPFDTLLASHDGLVDTLVTLFIGGAESDAQVAQLAGAVSLTGGTLTSLGVLNTLTNGEVWRAGDVSVNLGLHGFGAAHALTSGTSKTSCYLFNPALSGRILYLNKIIMTPDDRAGTPLALLNMLFETSAGAPGAWVADTQRDKQLNASSIVGQVYGFSSAGAFGAGGTLVRIENAKPFTLEFNVPLRLLENRYFGVGTNGANQHLHTHFEWFERVI